MHRPIGASADISGLLLRHSPRAPEVDLRGAGCKPLFCNNCQDVSVKLAGWHSLCICLPETRLREGKGWEGHEPPNEKFTLGVTFARSFFHPLALVRPYLGCRAALIGSPYDHRAGPGCSPRWI